MANDTNLGRRTMTAGELMNHLSKLDPNLLVLIEGNPEAEGDLGVRSVSVEEGYVRDRRASSAPDDGDVFVLPESRFRSSPIPGDSPDYDAPVTAVVLYA